MSNDKLSKATMELYLRQLLRLYKSGKESLQWDPKEFIARIQYPQKYDDANSQKVFGVQNSDMIALLMRLYKSKESLILTLDALCKMVKNRFRDTFGYYNAVRKELSKQTKSEKLDNELTPEEEKKYISYKELMSVPQKVKKIIMDTYGEMFLSNNELSKLTKAKQLAYLRLVFDYITLYLNNVRLMGPQVIELDGTTINLIAQFLHFLTNSLGQNPTKLLWHVYNNSPGEYDSNAGFSSTLSKLFVKYNGKQMSMNVIRHIVESHFIQSPTYAKLTNREKHDLHAKLLHSTFAANTSSTAHQVAIKTNNIRRLACDASGDVDVVGHNGSTVSLKLGGTLVTATAADLNGISGYSSCLSGITPGIASPSKAIVLDSSRSASNIYGLTFDMAGTGLNIPALKFNGVTFNQSYYIGITEGGVTASQAVVLNSTLDYSGIRNLSCTGAFVASTSIASPSLAVDTIAFSGSSKTIRDVSTLDFNTSSLSYKTVMRKSTLSGSAGIEVYDTQFSTPTNQPLVNFNTGNNSDPIYFRLQGYLNNGSIAANGYPHDIRFITGQGLLAGLNITTTNTSPSGAGVANDIVLSTRNATIPHLVVNDQYNQLHLWPQGLAELNTSYTQNVIIGEELLVRKTLCLGTSQDTSRMLSCLDSTMTSGSVRYWTFGSANSSNNQAEFAYNQDSTASYLGFGFYGATNIMSYSSAGNVAIGPSVGPRERTILVKDYLAMLGGPATSVL